jgi:hypothetical protein
MPKKQKEEVEPYINALELLLEGKSDEEKAAMVTNDWILARMVEAISGVGVWRFAKPAQINKTLELLATHRGMLVQKKQVSIDINAMMRQVPGDQLKEILDAEVITERLIENNRGDSGPNGDSGRMGI